MRRDASPESGKREQRDVGTGAGEIKGPFLIAIDGPAGSGKSTLAGALAARFGLAHVDTGAMYRALALKATETGVRPDDPISLSQMLASTEIELGGGRVVLDGRDVAEKIRTKEVSSAASQIAQIPDVRRWCVAKQREMAGRHPEGAVVEGRDIGTVVLPDAPLKIFLTADLEERASRRARQFPGGDAETLEKVRSRDRRDTERTASPLVAAEDAIQVDTSEHSAEEILDQVSRIVERAFGSGAAKSGRG